MKHPSESALALFAGGDLGPFAQWKTARHVEKCVRCRSEADGFASAIMASRPHLEELPGLSWNSLAAEMQANIRVGLAAGECVARAGKSKLAWRTGPVFAWAGLVAVAAVALWLQQPVSRLADVPGQAVLAVSHGGIELKEGGQMMSLMHAGAKNVTTSVSAEGAVRARYVDERTGQLTINNVYAQ